MGFNGSYATGGYMNILHCNLYIQVGRVRLLTILDVFFIAKKIN